MTQFEFFTELFCHISLVYFFEDVLYQISSEFAILTLWQRIHLLRFELTLQIAFCNEVEVCLHLRPPLVLDDILPFGFIVILPQVGLQLARKDLDGSGLACAVGSHETEDLALSGYGDAVEFEGVGTLPVGGLLLEVCGDVDDLDGGKGALIDADAAADAHDFAQPAALVCLLYLDTLLA